MFIIMDKFETKYDYWKEGSDGYSEWIEEGTSVLGNKFFESTADAERYAKVQFPGMKILPFEGTWRGFTCECINDEAYAEYYDCGAYYTINHILSICEIDKWPV